MAESYTIDQIEAAFRAQFSLAGLEACTYDDERIQKHWVEFELDLKTQGKQGGETVDRVLNDRVP